MTYAHNRYENLGSRLPFQRFGYVHSYNNYFNNITGSGINPRMGGHILVENNFFENALNPIFSQSTILGQWDLRNNNARSSADNARFNITLDGLLRQHSVPEGDRTGRRPRRSRSRCRTPTPRTRPRFRSASR